MIRRSAFLEIAKVVTGNADFVFGANHHRADHDPPLVTSLQAW